MKRKITITFDVDPTDYYQAKDSEFGAVDLVNAMLNREADLPEKMEITCGKVSRHFDVNE